MTTALDLVQNRGEIKCRSMMGKEHQLNTWRSARTQWRMTPPEEWPHHFIHTLEGIPGNWYIDQEMHRGTTEWTGLQQNFVVTFSFEHENPNIDSTLKLIQGSDIF
jgi:hypothetical protein